MKEKTHLVRNRCLFSIVIILVYFVCHRIPLNGIDMSAYDNLSLDLGAVLSLAVNGSNKQCYVFGYFALYYGKFNCNDFICDALKRGKGSYVT